jgi:uncharacterized protein YpbB
VNYLTYVILYCLKQFKGERSIFAIYHLLTGKKSAQTIQDGKLYRLSFLFGVYPLLNKEQLSEVIQDLTLKHFIVSLEKDRYVLTNEGMDILERQLAKEPLPKAIDGWKYGDIGKIFWKRLSLVIQTVSNLVRNHSTFIPITPDEEVISWVKQYLLHTQVHRKKLAEQLYQELFHCLSQMSNLEATVFVMSLSSHERIGLTRKQIASYLQEDETKLHFLFLNVLHHMIQLVDNQRHTYPTLYQMLYDLLKKESLTETAKKTLHLLNKGLTIEEIATFRKLKRSTIEDHIVEIALNVPGFSIDRFISKDKERYLTSILQKLQTKRLKAIKDVVGNDLTYFEIRLVLAKSGEQHA